MRPQVVVLMFGCKAQRGKDTACDYLVKNLGFQRFAFADKLKATVADLYGFSHEQMHGALKDTVDERYGIAPRVVLQDFGQEQRKRYPKIWAEYVFRQIDNEVDLTLSSIEEFKVAPEEMGIKDLYCISDFRFKNEYDVAYNWSLNNSKCDKFLYTVKMERDGITTVTGANNISEVDLDDFTKWNFMVSNNSTLESLYDRIDQIWQAVKR
jgi:hypothetical protein